MSNEKFCVNCKHSKFMANDSYHFGRYCGSPNITSRNLVTGGLDEPSRLCKVQREAFYMGRCGPEGQWFEPKPETPPSPKSSSFSKLCRLFGRNHAE